MYSVEFSYWACLALMQLDGPAARWCRSTFGSMLKLADIHLITMYETTYSDPHKGDLQLSSVTSQVKVTDFISEHHLVSF